MVDICNQEDEHMPHCWNNKRSNSHCRNKTIWSTFSWYWLTFYSSAVCVIQSRCQMLLDYGMPSSQGFLPDLPVTNWIPTLGCQRRRWRAKACWKVMGSANKTLRRLLGCVCSAMGRLLHTTENTSADIPQRANNTTKCALCEWKSKSESQGRFNLRLQSAHTL